VPISSSSPTTERLAHGAVAPPQIDEHAFKPFWRACDRLAKLHAAGSITAHEFCAAVAFRTTYERARRGPGGLRAADLTAAGGQALPADDAGTGRGSTRRTRPAAPDQ
jgi:hypothetical protein